MSDTDFFLAGLVVWFCLALMLPLLTYLLLTPFGYEVNVLFEPADLWVGAYYNRDKAIWYVCLIPTYGVKVERQKPAWGQVPDVLREAIKHHKATQAEAKSLRFEALLTQAIDLAFAFDRLVSAGPAEYRLREHLDAEPQIDDVVLMNQGDVPDELRLGMVKSKELVRAEGTLLDSADGTTAITIQTFDGRSVSWVGGRFIRLPSEEQVISRIAEGSPLAETVGH